jgi:3-(3-hydroxy-phenyl)propionate hydroxylase
MAKPDPVVVVGAGPVGLCLALALAQQDVAVVLVEALSDDNFLDQVPRAGSNHPTTLEFFDRIGLYARWSRAAHRAQVPVLGPARQCADRRVRPRAAQGRHALSLCAAMRAHQDHRRSAEDGEGASADRGAMATEFVSFEQNSDACGRTVKNAAGEAETINGSYLVSAEGARSIVAEGCSRSNSRASPIRNARSTSRWRYDFRKHGYTERNYISDPDEYSNLVPLEGPAGPLAHPLSDRDRDDENELKRPEALQAPLKRFLGIDHDSRFAAAILYTVHQRVAKKFARAASCSPATPPTSTARSAAWG